LRGGRCLERRQRDDEVLPLGHSVRQSTFNTSLPGRLLSSRVTTAG
jgi:hypothetical protein